MQSRKTKRSYFHPIRVTLIVIICLMLAIWAVFALANHPKEQAKQETIAIAKTKAQLKNPSIFYTYNREKTYYTIAGENRNNKKIFVVVPKGSKNVTVLKQNEGITKNMALTQIWNKRNPKRVLKITLGIFNDAPVWEVTYENQKGNLCYELLSFKNGKDIQKIVNI